MNLCEFFCGIESNVAFSLTLDEKGKFVRVKNTEYELYYSDIYPFDIFEKEFQGINEYCYRISQFVLKEYNDAVSQVEKYQNLPEGELCCGIDNELYYGIDTTNFEMLMSCRSDLYMWEYILWQGACHLIVLLYAFLERSVQKICLDLFEADVIKTAMKKSNGTKLYRYLELLCGIDIHHLFEANSRLYEILEESRQLRNQFAHGTFEKRGFQDTFEYEEVQKIPSFRLIELIDAIGFILYLLEKRYEFLLKNNDSKTTID